MKIGIFTNNYLPNPYGVTGSIESFRKELERAGHEVFIFAPKWKGYADSNPRVFRYPSVDIEIKFKFPLAIPFSGKLDKMLDGLDLDIIHAQHPNLLGSAAKKWAQKKNIPLVFTWHTLYDQYTAFVPFLPAKITAGYIIRKAVTFANASSLVIAPTESIIEKLRAWGVKSAIVPVVTGVDEEMFSNPDRMKVRKCYGIKDDEILLILISRLTAEKNIEFVFEALKNTLRGNGKIKLMIGGGGYLLPKLEDFVRKENIAAKVIFAGIIDQAEVKNYLASGDIFVHASRSETQGMTVSEAMYAGLPIVAVDASGVSSLVENNINGFLVSENTEEFSRTVELLSEDKGLRQRFGAESYRIARERYTAKISAQKMLAIYKKLIGAK